MHRLEKPGGLRCWGYGCHGMGELTSVGIAVVNRDALGARIFLNRTSFAAINPAPAAVTA